MTVFCECPPTPTPTPLCSNWKRLFPCRLPRIPLSSLSSCPLTCLRTALSHALLCGTKWPREALMAGRGPRSPRECPAEFRWGASW